MQNGHQAIHLAAAVGNLNIVKVLVQKYKVSPTSATAVNFLAIVKPISYFVVSAPNRMALIPFTLLHLMGMSVWLITL